jgi:hypothetical protein
VEGIIRTRAARGVEYGGSYSLAAMTRVSWEEAEALTHLAFRLMLSRSCSAHSIVQKSSHASVDYRLTFFLQHYLDTTTLT